ncbi:MAG: MSCRAMM family protein, partial [Thermoleophilia bacterium]
MFAGKINKSLLAGWGRGIGEMRSFTGTLSNAGHELKSRNVIFSICLAAVMLIIILAPGRQDSAGAYGAPGGTGSISGRVTDTAGAPVAGVGIWVTTETGYQEAITDANGEYTVGFLGTGSYRVEFNYRCKTLYYNNTDDWQSAELVAVTDGNDTGGINLTLSLPGGAISGTVTNASGQPLQNVSVAVMPTDPGSCFIWDVVTDAGGNYIVRNVAAGTYRLQFNAAGHPTRYYDGKTSAAFADLVTVTDGVTPGIDVSMTSGGTITGTVTDSSGQPLQYVSVNASSITTGGDSATTDANGNFTISGLTTGYYQVFFYVWGHSYSQGYVAVTDGVTTSISASLSPPAIGTGSISGTITDSFGQPLPFLTGYVVGQFPNNVDTPVSTDANGDYSATGLAAGSYRILFYAWNNTYFYNNKPDWNSADMVTVNQDSATTGVNMSLTQPGTASISGMVTDATGQPLTHVAVYLDRNDGTWSGICAYAYTDSSGNYSFSALPAGSYTVTFYNWDKLFYFNRRIQLPSATRGRFKGQAAVASVLLKRPSKRSTCEMLRAAYPGT